MIVQRIGADRALFIEGMKGLGDCIYQRAVIRRVPGPVVISTPWPQLLADLPNVRCARPPGHNLRTQMKNELANEPAGGWAPRPATIGRNQIGYGPAEFRRGLTILQAMELKLQGRGQPLTLDLPSSRKARLPAGAISERPIAVIRPVTIRSEWRNESRAPDPAVICEISQRLMRSHHVVLIGDLAPGREWLVGDLPAHHSSFMHGELDIMQLIALLRSSDLAVGGVGWIVPMALAARSRLYCVLGGNGGANRPEVITDPRLDASRIGWAYPDRFCPCYDMAHQCNKRISHPLPAFEKWASDQGIRL